MQKIRLLLVTAALLTVVGCADKLKHPEPPVPPPVYPVPLQVGRCELINQQATVVEDKGGLRYGMYVLPHRRVIVSGGQIECAPKS